MPPEDAPTITTRRTTITAAPPPASPSRPLVLSARVADLVIGAAFLSLIAYTLGYASATSDALDIATRAEAAAEAAESTLSEARRLCGAPR